MPPVKGKHFHLIIRTKSDENIESVKSALDNFIKELKHSISRCDKFLIGEERGEKNKKLHWHMHLELNIETFGNVVTSWFYKYCKIKNITRISIVKDIRKSKTYAVKNSVYDYYNFTSTEVEQLYKEGKDILKEKKVKATHPVEIIMNNVKENHDVITNETVAIETMEFYLKRKKGYNDYQVQSVAKAVYLHLSKKAREKELMRLINYLD